LCFRPCSLRYSDTIFRVAAEITYIVALYIRPEYTEPPRHRLAICAGITLL
jgi:hypothetical protein